MLAVDFSILNQKATPAIYADTLANRPAASFAGRLFVDTASPYGIYRDTGSAWVQIASNGGGGSSTGVNGLNGTTNIGLGGTLANNTTIIGGNNQLTITAVSTFNNSALNYNATGGAVGDVANVFLSSSSLRLNKTNLLGVYSELNFINTNIKSIFSGANFGLSLDDTTGKFVLGDYNNQRKYNSFVVNDDTNEFYFTTSFNQSNTAQDLFYANNASAGSRFVKIGDFNDYTNGVTLVIDDANSLIYTQSLNTGSGGIELNFQYETYKFGAGLALIECDKISKQITLQTNTLIFDSGFLQSGTSGGNSGQHLVIFLNGNQYKIKLENP